MALQPNDRAEFSEILTRTAEMYGTKMQPSLLELWWDVLADFDMPAIRRALTMHLRNPDTGQFMPKPADVIRMLGGTTLDAAQIAWAKVHGAVRRVGSWMDVIFDDPLIHCVLGDMGGWVLLCSTLEDEMPFKAREFENRYRGYARQQAAPQGVPSLTGRINAQNLAEGHLEHLVAPMLVGDPERCVQVRQLTATAAGPNITMLGDFLPKDLALIKRIK